MRLPSIRHLCWAQEALLEYRTASYLDTGVFFRRPCPFFCDLCRPNALINARGIKKYSSLPWYSCCGSKNCHCITKTEKARALRPSGMTSHEHRHTKSPKLHEVVNMKRRFLTGVSFVLSVLWVSSALAQHVDLGAARQTVLDVSSHQISALESVVTQVPPHAQYKITEAIKANESSRNEALAALDRAQNGHISNHEGVVRAYDAVDHGTWKHTQVLTDLLDTVPDGEARLAIERALDVSQTGRNTALSNLDAIKQGQPISSGLGTTGGRPSTLPRPEGTGAVSGSSRPAAPPIGGSPSGFGKPSGSGGIFGGGGPRGFPGGGRPGR